MWIKLEKDFVNKFNKMVLNKFSLSGRIQHFSHTGLKINSRSLEMENYINTCTKILNFTLLLKLDALRSYIFNN